MKKADLRLLSIANWCVPLTCLCLAIHAAILEAVILERTDNPSTNTTAPTGALEGSGWQYQGKWGSFLGTPIAPTFFIAAKHIGGSTNWTFTLNGVNFQPIAWFDCPDSDLRIWKVKETFVEWAPLYTKNDEVEKQAVVFGRGTQRGEEVNVNSQVKGWKNGIKDGVLRWGENMIDVIDQGDPGIGETLQAEFNRNGLFNEAHLSSGDSSGGLFIQDDNEWKLAGVNYAVTGNFSFDGTSSMSFSGALLDIGGLWIGSGTAWAFISDFPSDTPSSFFSTRISSNIEWINRVIDFELGNDVRIDSIQIEQDGTVSITFPTTLNRLYRVEHSPTWPTKTWSLLTNEVSGTDHPVTVKDPEAGHAGQQIYRLILLK